MFTYIYGNIITAILMIMHNPYLLIRFTIYYDCVVRKSNFSPLPRLLVR